MKPVVRTMVLLSLAACQQRAPQNLSVANEATPMKTVQAAPEVNSTANIAAPDRTRLIEPKGSIDPKNREAAGQVVQHYGALIEQGKFTEAAGYWSDGASASTFAKQLQASGLKHLEIGKPSDPEGAAGSSYVTMPVFFYGGNARKAADIILRRVNDVPGSTEAQRRWHIEHIEWTTR
jgi:hypothetical protein